MTDRKKDEELLEDAHLGIIFRDDSQIRNPIEEIPEFISSKPELYYTYLLSRPEYFSLACKTLLNVNLHPMQGALLKMLWEYKFPMLIGSRGFGKAEPIDTPILTDNGWVNMGNLSIGSRIYGRNGHQYNVVAIHPQGKKRVCRLKLMDGRVIDCCEDHLWTVSKAGRKNEVTIPTKEIIKNHLYKHKDKIYYLYRIPNCDPIQYDKKELPIEPYILGYLLGNGCLTTLTPKISTDDKFVVDEFTRRLPNFEIKKDTSNNNYTIVDKNTKMNRCIECNNLHRNSMIEKLCELKLRISCKNKFIPDIYKKSTIEDRMELIRGLLDSDGSVSKDGNIEFTNSSENLVDDLIEVLRSLGITCIKSIDNREGQEYINPSGNKAIRGLYYRVYINTSKPVFKLPRKLNRIKKRTTLKEYYIPIISAEYIDEYKEMQCITVDSPDNTYITKNHVVTHNSYMLAVYCLLRVLFLRKRKVIICGSGFRQSKIIFQYMESIIANSSILKTIIRPEDIIHDNAGWKLTCGDSSVLAIPLGTGDKIRGLRANDIIADEMSSIPIDIFETVVQGFAAVASSPTEQAAKIARKKAAKNLGIKLYDNDDDGYIANQIILSGTAYYSFNHFAQYHDKYLRYIKSRGNVEKIKELVGDNYKDFNWKDYCIIRIPVDLIPEGFMDPAQIARARATVNSGIYSMEYGSVFSSDSNGFFKRSLIEGCVVKPGEDLVKPSGITVPYITAACDCLLSGNKDKKYIMGIDPAMSQDNFSVVILEINPDCRKVVYCWTTNKNDHIEKLKLKISTENNYFAYCARKIRGLMQRFNIVAISIDTAGGGRTVMESLNDKNLIRPGELELWPMIDTSKPKDTDYHDGLHIIDPIVFTREDWTTQANHGLKKDMEDKVLLFPHFDAVTIVSAEFEDHKTDNEDTIERCIEEVEELKNELCTITVTLSPITNRERFDTPEMKLPNGKKGRLLKDRYSALLMANMTARTIEREFQYDIQTSIGGFANSRKGEQEENPSLFRGNQSIVNKFNALYGDM